MHEGHRERLREQFLLRGLHGLNEHQVLELLLTYSIPRKDTNEIAHTLINQYGSLGKVLDANAVDLMKMDGIGEYSAVFLALVGQVARRVMLESPQRRIRLNTPRAAGEYTSKLLWRYKHEVLYVFCLDKRRYLIHGERLNEGTVSEAVVYPRQVVEIAIRHGAQNVIIAHNHPSGDCQPSLEDIDATENIRAALSGIGISLFDHIIVGSDCFFSFSQRQQFPTGETQEQPLLAAEKQDET